MAIASILLLSGLQLSIAFQLSGKIEFEKLPFELRAQTSTKSSVSVFKITDKYQFEASLPVDASGGFQFKGDAGEPYLLKAKTPSVLFQELLVDARSSGTEPLISAYNAVNVTSSRPVSELRFTPVKLLVFEPPKEAFDALQFLKNPMVLFAGAMMIMMTFLGRLQENLGDDGDVRATETKALVDQTMKIFRQ
jgi:hypothetical protein